MSDNRAAAALVTGAIGFCFGLFVAFANLPWLGVPAGVASLMTGYFAYRISVSTVDNERTVTELRDEVDQLETAVASQIQARFAAETADDDPNGEDPIQDSAGDESQNGARPDGHEVTADDRPGPAEAPPAETEPGLSDAVTSLFNEAYFGVTVEARISSARRHLRPVAVVMLDVVEGLDEGSPRQADPSFIAERVIETVREADTACRMHDGRFALILEDTPENGAIWTVERLRRRLTNEKDGLTVWAGIACYPAHAFDTDEILSQAERALDAAREWHQDRIEVAEAQ